MNPNPRINPRYFLFILTILVSLRIPGYFCQNDQQYETCSRPFQCGDITEISYPFWGGDRPASCGYPGFRLDCQGDDLLINISSTTYRVLNIDNPTQTLRIARNDLWDTVCPRFPLNTTLDFRLFDYYSASNDQNITLYYGCTMNPMQPTLPNQFDCDVNGRISLSFYMTREAPGLESGIRCDRNISVPVNRTAAQVLAIPMVGSTAVLEDALMSGFSIRWSADDENCQNCVGSGGVCGYNQGTTSFACYTRTGNGCSCSCCAPPPNQSRKILQTSTKNELIPLPPMPPSLSSLLALLAAALLTAAYSQPSTTYPNCHRTFSCGPLVNITYPFTGGDRPSHCGPPDFALTCRNATTTELTHDSLTYRVLQLDQTQNALTLSRSDLYNNTCPSEFHNTTLNTTLFPYNGPPNEVLTLFYGCNTSGMSIRPSNLFSCNSTGSDFSDAYRLIGPVPSDPILRIISCSVSISVPILRDVGNRLAGLELSLGEALMEGFSVNYRNPYERLCLECIRLGGQCGFDSDSDSGRPVCICDDSVCPFDVTLPPEASPNALGGNGRSNMGRNIGLPIAGAVLAGVGLGWLIFYYKQRRKHRLAAQSTQTLGKEITPPVSIKPLSTLPSSNFTASIPSYPSSNSELGRSSTYFGVQVFDYTELEEATNKFDPSRELGDGGFGTVYYGVLPDGRVVAVKRLYENNFKRVEQFMNEVEILTRLRHQNLVLLYGCTSKRSRGLLLVYEYIPNGTVADHLHGKRAKSGLLSWPIRLNIAIETADALAYLHKSDIIHRDVKTNNILLDNDFHVKVADFGLSRLFPTDVTHVSTAPQGTPGYVDPEYYQCYHLTEKSDVYSFGVVLIELISSLPAVDTNRHRHDINLANMAVNKIQNHTLHELVDSSVGFETNSSVRRMATLVAELAFRCLQQERDMRPSMEEVLEGLRGIQNEDLNAHKVEIVDILVDEEVGLLKGSVAPPSPDSGATDKSASGSTPNSSG
ncbi:hypothetical protein BUALT_Bualt04G0083300 [Buddleja alternifolia]|uniref:non-specific serine/threonine protein kinase n=1 Tax=Buddleja alternifolia TaxID=168488 RepID=A0AAV6XMC0_9LAMI|nr:hypothetical protein BUALT_Bualt04G0083300 [Buddleja alternifolia]